MNKYDFIQTTVRYKKKTTYNISKARDELGHGVRWAAQGRPGQGGAGRAESRRGRVGWGEARQGRVGRGRTGPPGGGTERGGRERAREGGESERMR